MNDEIVKAESTVTERWSQSKEVAKVVKEFALKKCITIQGKRYPTVEVWQAIANTFGCVASAKDVRREGALGEAGGGFAAIGEVRKVMDGTLVATAEGFLGDDEPVWAKRPVFARRAMAQTRAISRACRSAFAFVIPMMDASIQTTPAEEMESLHQTSVVRNGNGTSHATEELKEKLAKTLGIKKMVIEPYPEEEEAVMGDETSQDTGASEMAATYPFNPHKGKPLSEVPSKNLNWARSKINPDDPKWGEGNRFLIMAIERELEKRAGKVSQ